MTESPCRQGRYGRGRGRGRDGVVEVARRAWRGPRWPDDEARGGPRWPDEAGGGPTTPMRWP